jgi:hypothetical protein
MVFTRQFSTFDRQNLDSANSPFQGFFVLFWIAVAFLIVKMGADNWRKTGNPLGTNEIMINMFSGEGERCSMLPEIISADTRRSRRPPAL